MLALIESILSLMAWKLWPGDSTLIAEGQSKDPYSLERPVKTDWFSYSKCQGP